MISIKYKDVEIGVTNANEAVQVLKGLGSKNMERVSGQVQIGDLVQVKTKRRAKRHSNQIWTNEELEFLYPRRFLKPRFLRNIPELSNHPVSTIQAVRLCMAEGKFDVYKFGEYTTERIKALREGRSASSVPAPTKGLLG